MPSRRHTGLYFSILAILLTVAAPPPALAAAATVKVAFWNVRAGKGVNALPGHVASFTDTTNCTDASQPLNAWGVGAMQNALTQALNDPSVIALGLAESWYSVCGSPDNVRKALGWKATTGEQNGVGMVARYGFAGPAQWQQLDTSLNTTPADTMWVVRAPVCLDAGCTASMPVYVGHWYGTGTSAATSYARQAQQTAAFLASTASSQPHVFVGDLNVWEGSSIVCNQSPNNTTLGYLRNAGYLDAWLTIHGGAEGFTGMANRAGCGYPEGYTWKRIDYAWTPASEQPLDIQRFGMVTPGDASPSDHYGIVVTLPYPGAPVTTTTGSTSTTTTTTPGNGDIVLYAKSARAIAGAWSLVPDTTAAGGMRMSNPDAGVAKLASASASPASYFDIPFTPEAGRAYRLWIRGRAQNDSWQNDSTFVQFSGSLASDGTPAFRIGTTSATVVSIEESSGAGVSGWGWQDNGYGVGVLGPAIYFDGSPQTIRFQVREDGLSIDQIVLSPVTYFTTAPGAAKNDATVLTETGGTAASTTTTSTTTTSTTSSTSSTGTTPTSTGAVTWTNLVNTTANGSSLTKSSGCNDCSDAGGVSQQSIGSDGAVTFAITPGTRLVVGLGRDASSSTSYAIDYAFSFSANGTFEIREAGLYRSEGTFGASDTFTIAVASNRVSYYRNATLVYTSGVSSAGSMVLDASIQTIGAGVVTAAVR